MQHAGGLFETADSSDIDLMARGGWKRLTGQYQTGFKLQYLARTGNARASSFDGREARNLRNVDVGLCRAVRPGRSVVTMSSNIIH
jgi:hypothetical protein